jgi:hypothetical protein
MWGTIQLADRMSVVLLFMTLPFMTEIMHSRACKVFLHQVSWKVAFWPIVWLCEHKIQHTHRNLLKLGHKALCVPYLASLTGILKLIFLKEKNTHCKYRWFFFYFRLSYNILTYKIVIAHLYQQKIIDNKLSSVKYFL